MSVLRIVFRIDPLTYSFASGIFVSIAANLFTGVYSTDTAPMRIHALLLSAGLALASGIAWIFVASEVEKFGRLVARMIGTGLSIEQAESDVASTRGATAQTAVVAAIALAIACLAVLIPFGGGTAAAQAPASGVDASIPASGASTKASSANTPTLRASGAMK